MTSQRLAHKLEVELRADSQIAARSTENRNRRIRDLRERGYTLRSLAALTGLSHTQIANICAR